MPKVKIISRRKAFTLIELLVVISIIAVLLSILMPALSKAKYMTKRLICLTRVRDQATSQLTYASDWDGRFSPNNANGPQYMRSPLGGGVYTFDAMINTYITNTEVMFCPILDQTFGKHRRTYSSGYGGWNIMEWSGISDQGQNWDPSNGPPTFVYGVYCWFANLRRGSDLGGYPPVTFLDGEPKWPMNMSECSSRAAFISHEMSSYGLDSLYWDSSHGGKGITFGQPIDEMDTEDSPVGYSDGSVIFHKKNEMKPRGNVAHGAGDYYYWY